jgi:hypothetical protein
MTGQDLEIAEYLGYLLNHARECQSDACPTCVTFHTVVDGMKTRLFFSLVYQSAVMEATAFARRF